MIKKVTARFDSVRRRMLVTVVGLIMLIAVLIAAPLVFSAFKSADAIATLQTSLLMEQADQQMTRYFTPILAAITSIRQWGMLGLLPVTNSTAMNAMLMPVLDTWPPIPSVVVASQAGAEYQLLKTASGWETQVTFPPERPRESLQLGQQWQEFSQVSSRWSRSSYTPTNRPWFTGAEIDDVNWSTGYVYTTGIRGITGSRGWRYPAGTGMYYVAGIDVSERDITALSSNLPNNAGCYIFILKSETVTSAIPSSTVVSVQPVRTNIIQAAIAAWQSGKHSDGIPFSYRLNTERWWACLRPFSVRNQNDLIGIVVSSRALKDSVQERQYGLLGIAVAIIFAGCALAALVIYWYRRALNELSSERKLIHNSEQNLKQLIERGEGRELEFKSTLRMNLQTGKPGKEIELSWLKAVAAFLNTDGGTLLVGVHDDGSISGIDADDFPNEDKFLLHFNNLFNQHIGLEFARNIQFELRPCAAGKILIVECEPSHEAVFLKVHSQEDFYIRVGPSSRKLSTSQAFAYMNKRA